MSRIILVEILAFPSPFSRLDLSFKYQHLHYSRSLPTLRVGDFIEWLMMTELVSKNPAVEKLLAAVVNPLSAASFQLALRRREPLIVEHLTDPLLAPAFILANVARDFGNVLVDDYGLLRKRLEELEEDVPALVTDLLGGAGFNEKPRTYPESAAANCAPGEVRLEYLPVGSGFYLAMGAGRTKRGTLISKTASRAVVEWEGKATERSFTDHRSGEEVTITASGRTRTGCALDCGVIPIHRVIAAADHDWAVNAFKDLTGAFDDESTVRNSSGKRRSR